MTREQWLHNATDALRERFQSIAPLPAKLHISIGFPSKRALAGKRQVLGECWTGQGHILISPVLATAFEVIDTLAHELVHAATPGEGHKGKFLKVAKAVGLTNGKPTSVGAGPEFAADLKKLIKKLGPLPHSALVAIGRTKVQGTRMIKASCDRCGYTVRLTQKWIDVGVPSCPLHPTRTLSV